MAEATSAYTLQDLILRIALAAKIAYYGSDGTSKACIPVDEHNFDACLRCANDGVKEFIANAPPNGWQWRNRIAEVTFATVQTEGTVDSGDATSLIDATLASTYDTDDEIVGYYVYDQTLEIYAAITAYTAATGDITVAAWLNYDETSSSDTPAAGDDFSITNLKTVNGDKARYYLPDTFMGEYTGKITYAEDSNVGHIITWAHEGEIRFNREGSVSTGHPTQAAVRPSPVRRRWELIVSPSPTSAKTVTFPYRIGFNDMQAISGTAFNGSATALVTTDSHVWKIYPDDYFNGWTIEIVSGTGLKSYATITDFDSTDGTSAVFTVASWLAADGSSTGIAPALNSIYYVTDGYRHPAGAQFDKAILSSCKAQAEREFEDAMGFMSEFLEKDLPAAWAIDGRSSPKSVGIMKSGGQRIKHYRQWDDVTST